MSKNPIKLKQRSSYHPKHREQILDALDEMLQEDPDLGRVDSLEAPAPQADSNPVDRSSNERPLSRLQKPDSSSRRGAEPKEEEKKEAEKRERQVREARVVPW